MSTPTLPNRADGGRPDGGQFVKTSFAEATDVTLDGREHRPELPEWGPELDDTISAGVIEWSRGLGDGRHGIALTELIGTDDPDALTVAYGEHRAAWMREVTVESSVTTNRKPRLPVRDGTLFVRHDGDQIGYTPFGDRHGAPEVTVLAHCPPEPSSSVEQHSYNSVGSGVELRLADGRLNDAADGTPAVRRFSSRGRLLEEAHYVAGLLHSPTPGAPASIEYRSDGDTVMIRSNMDVPANGPDGEPNYERRTAAGTTHQIFQTGSTWQRSVTLDPAGNITHDLIPDPVLPGARLETLNDPSTGRSQITRRTTGNLAVDGPDGEPAVEFRRYGKVTSQTWKTRGVWTKTTDYNAAGDVAVEFDNDNWPGE